MLSRLVAYDYVVVDIPSHTEQSDVYDSVVAALPGGGLVRLLDRSDQFQEEVIRETIQLTDSAFKSTRGRLPNTVEEKYAQDDIGPLTFALGNLVYGYKLGVPVFLRDGSSVVQQATSLLRLEALRLVEERVDNAMLAKARELVSSAYRTSLSFEAPPLGNFILNTAQTANLSLIDAMLQIRETREATEFRKWLGQINRLIMKGGRSGLLEATSEIETVGSMVDSWAKSLSTDEGLKFKRAKIDLEAIPVFGWIAKLLGREKIDIKDPMLTSPPLYLAFIGQWYQDTST